jgi:hypothetical protein
LKGLFTDGKGLALLRENGKAADTAVPPITARKLLREVYEFMGVVSSLRIYWLTGRMVSLLKPPVTVDGS